MESCHGIIPLLTHLLEMSSLRATCLSLKIERTEIPAAAMQEYFSAWSICELRTVRTLHSSSAKDIIQERFVELSLSAIHLHHLYTLASSALNLWYVPFCYWQPREQSLGIFFWNHKKSRNQLLSWWIWRVSPCLLGGYQESTQNSSLLPQVNTNLFNLIAWMRNKGRCILI